MNQRISNQQKLQIDAPPQEPVRAGRLGAIVGVCFALGVAWPFLAGVKLVPSAPAEEDDPTSEVTESNPTAGAPSGPGAAVPERVSEETIEIEKSTVISCRTKDGKKPRNCDKPALSPLLDPRLLGLVACEGAKGAEGVLSLGLKLDFGTKKITDVVKGKSSTLEAERTKSLLACAKADLTSVSLEAIAHEQREYLVFYFLKFLPPGAPESSGSSASGAVIPAQGTATVVFESGMIRARPDESSDLRARLLYGTRVFVTGRVGDWYEVKYDSRGRKGFVHKNAIGMP